MYYIHMLFLGNFTIKLTSSQVTRDEEIVIDYFNIRVLDIKKRVLSCGGRISMCVNK